MSLVVRHECEFCKHLFLKRLSGQRGVFGSHDTCPQCGKKPTSPEPKPENLRPISEMFPGYKVDRATEAPFVVGEVELQPLSFPSLKIFELESKPWVKEAFEQQYAGVPFDEPACKCGHYLSAHKRKNDPLERLGFCRGDRWNLPTIHLESTP